MVYGVKRHLHLLRVSCKTAQAERMPTARLEAAQAAKRDAQKTITHQKNKCSPSPHPAQQSHLFPLPTPPSHGSTPACTPTLPNQAHPLSGRQCHTYVALQNLGTVYSWKVPSCKQNAVCHSKRKPFNLLVWKLRLIRMAALAWFHIITFRLEARSVFD